VGGEEDGRRVGRTGDASEEVAGVRSRGRAAVVLEYLEPGGAQLCGDEIGHRTLAARRALCFTEANEVCGEPLALCL
jgi:hypothetical protein